MSKATSRIDGVSHMNYITEAYYVFKFLMAFYALDFKGFV